MNYDYCVMDAKLKNYYVDRRLDIKVMTNGKYYEVIVEENHPILNRGTITTLYGSYLSLTEARDHYSAVLDDELTRCSLFVPLTVHGFNMDKRRKLEAKERERKARSHEARMALFTEIERDGIRRIELDLFD